MRWVDNAVAGSSAKRTHRAAVLVLLALTGCAGGPTRPTAGPTAASADAVPEGLILARTVDHEAEILVFAGGQWMPLVPAATIPDWPPFEGDPPVHEVVRRVVATPDRLNVAFWMAYCPGYGVDRLAIRPCEDVSFIYRVAQAERPQIKPEKGSAAVSDEHVAWPSDERIAFVRSPAHARGGRLLDFLPPPGELMTFDLREGKVATLVAGTADYASLEAGGAGGEVAFIRVEDQRRQGYWLPAAGGAPRRLLGGSGDHTAIGWVGESGGR